MTRAVRETILHGHTQLPTALGKKNSPQVFGRNPQDDAAVEPWRHPYLTIKYKNEKPDEKNDRSHQLLYQRS